MKLYFSPGACSLSPHIALCEAGLAVDLEKVDLRAHKTADGGDYYKVNPKGYVPALVLDDGQLLTEGAAILQYIADRKPEMKLAPPPTSPERYRLQEWLNFVAAEVHKGFSPLFNPKLSDETKEIFKANLARRFELLAHHLEAKPFLMGDAFSVADGYLFTVLRWTVPLKVDLSKWPPLKAYMDRVAARPRVREALSAEGLQ